MFEKPISEVYQLLARPYMRSYAMNVVLGESRINWVTGSPLVSSLLSQAAIWSIDCTYNEISDKKETYYLMNIAFFCDELQRRKCFH